MMKLCRRKSGFLRLGRQWLAFLIQANFAQHGFHIDVQQFADRCVIIR